MNAITPISACCPTCGGPLCEQFFYDHERRTFIANGVSVRFTRAQSLVMDAVWRWRHRGAIPYRSAFADIVWANDIDGGPEDTCVLSVHLARIREKLRPAGYTISKNRGSPKVGYRLIKLEADQ